MDEVLKKVYYCAKCKKVCGEITLKRYLLTLEKFSQSGQYALKEKEYDDLVQYYSLGELNKIYEMDREYVAFYCPKCNKCYCVNHWVRITEFDEGYYDAEYGTCPKGHRRMLFD